MTQNEMIVKLAGKCGVSLEEARAALETAEGNELTATHLLEQERFRRMQELNAVAEGGEAAAVQFAPEETVTGETGASAAYDDGAAQAAGVDRVEAGEKAAFEKRCGSKGLRNLGKHVRRVIACGNRNRFIVRKGEERLLEMPVTALALLMLCAFWVCVPLLVIGLFAGCRYSFAGRDLGREAINSALGKATDVADRVKQSVAQA